MKAWDVAEVERCWKKNREANITDWCLFENKIVSSFSNALRVLARMNERLSV